MTERYYRTVFTWEVLSNEPITTDDPGDLTDMTYYGDASGLPTCTTPSEEVTKERIAELLVAQGSDPEFLIHDEDDT